MTRRSKLILGLVVAPVVVLGFVVAAAFLSPVQTLVARKALSGQGDVRSVSAGLDGARVEGFVLDQPGLKVSVPSLEVRVPVVGAAQGKIEVGSLVARDIVVEFDPVAFAARPASETAPAPAEPFDGVFKLVTLPAGLKVDGLDLSGTVRVGGATPLVARFALNGGGVASGGSGRMTLTLDADAGTSGTVKSSVDLSPTLDASGRLESVGLAVQALAQGGALPAPAELRINARIAREGSGETYSLQLAKGDKTLVDLATGWEPGAGLRPGKWKLALDSVQLRPFLPAEVKLPDVALVGEGALRSTEGGRVRADGVLRADVTALEQAGLPALGPVLLSLGFDVEAGGAETRLHALTLDLDAAGAPVLSVRAKQPFSVAPSPFALRPSDAGGALVEARLLGVPAKWIQAFVPGLTVDGPITAAFTARPEGAGFVVESSAPFSAPALRYAQDGSPLAALDGVHLDRVRATYAASGLVAEIGSLQVVAKGGENLLTGNVSARQPAGQPIRAQAAFRLALARIVDQPALKGLTRLSAGEASLRIDAMAGDVVSAKADLNLTGLRAAGTGELPALSLTLDATRAADGALKVVLPLEVANAVAKRKSDLRLDLALRPGSPTTNVSARLTGPVLHVPDLQAFAALAAAPAPSSAAPAARAAVPTASATAAARPLWAGYAGELELDLPRIVYAPGLEIRETRGRLAVTEDAAALEKLRLLLGTGGSLEVGGKLAWDASARGYALSANVAGTDVATGPLLKALAPSAQAPLDGTYAVSAKVSGAGADPASAISAAAAEFKLEGRAGVIRSLNLDTNKYARAGNAIAGLAGLAGALSGNEEIARRAAQVAALNDVARKFANLAYDRISLTATRSASGAVEIGELKLESPEMLLDGAGGLRAVAGRSLLELPLSLKLDLGARGDLASKLETLRLLTAAAQGADAAAFRTLKDPVLLDGTLGQIGTSQLTRLLARALGE